jgi:hypothetical protein
MRTGLVFGLLGWCSFGVFAWIMRDGLGPDSVESGGWEAVIRLFWSFYWGPIFILLAAAVMLTGRRSSAPDSTDANAP